MSTDGRICAHGVEYDEECPDCQLVYMTAGCRTREELERYLGFSAAIVEGTETKRGRYAAVVRCEAVDANWMSMRLASGMCGGHIKANRHEAIETMRMLADLA